MQQHPTTDEIYKQLENSDFSETSLTKLASPTEVLPKFPEVIDSTIIALFSDCPLKCYREHFLGLSSPVPSIHLHAGGAFAHALEVVRRERWEKDRTFNDCLETAFRAYTRFWGDVEPPKHGTGANKTFERMWQAVEFYFEQYPIDTDPIRPHRFPDGRTGVEFTFGIPLPINHPDTGDPIIYGGRFDLLGYYDNLNAVIDEKTTTALGASWANQWKMRGQMLGYVWAARQSGVDVRHAVIRGIAILKTKFNTLPVIESGYQDYMLDRWYYSMVKKVDRMVRYYNDTQKMLRAGGNPENPWPMSFSTACTNYGGCAFVDLCTSPKPERWYGDFDIRRWNPLAKNPLETNS